jgi:hypothetical protein
LGIVDAFLRLVQIEVSLEAHEVAGGYFNDSLP